MANAFQSLPNVGFASLTDEQKSAARIHGYSAELVIKVQSMIDSALKGELAPNTAYENIWEDLLAAQIVKVGVLNVDEVGCHPCNRGKLGLNGHNVQRNGHEVDKVGVDLNELHKAASFELCPLEPKKSFQLKFNNDLVQNAHGLIAKLTGREKHLSVGTGHWTAWVRAIKGGCRTPFKDMASGNGTLSADRFRSKDSRMGKCMDEGWSWRQFPWQCEVAWPQLPDLCQRALNSSHSVSSRSTELECMVWVAEQAKESNASHAEFSELMEAIAMGGPSCAGYINCVGELALQVCGGDNSPLLFFLDRFGKLYGENKTLGEEFVRSTANLVVSKTDKVNWIKAALVATNLASDKIVDGISKLIVKADVDKLRNGDRKLMALSMNGFIEHGWNLADKTLENGIISQDEFDKIFGMLMVRCITLLCDKQKVGPEKNRTWQSVDEIKNQFCVDIMSIAGDAHVDLGDWKVNVPIPAKIERERSSEENAKGKAVLLSIEQQNDPEHIFKEHGFVVGGFVHEKTAVNHAFKIISAGSKVCLDSVDNLELRV